MPCHCFYSTDTAPPPFPHFKGRLVTYSQVQNGPHLTSIPLQGTPLTDKKNPVLYFKLNEEDMGGIQNNGKTKEKDKNLPPPTGTNLDTFFEKVKKKYIYIYEAVQVFTLIR